MNCVKWVEVKFFSLCLEERRKCAEINAISVFASGSIFDPLKAEKFLPSDDMKE
jgi:hypothetical protein